MWEDILAAVREVEAAYGAKFADPQDPLLFSVRSGAAVSMPVSGAAACRTRFLSAPAAAPHARRPIPAATCLPFACMPPALTLSPPPSRTYPAPCAPPTPARRCRA